jgi:hypothetical protein
VVEVTGTTGGYTESIPVQVVGASTAPVPPAPSSVPPAIRVSDLRVLGKATLASSLGGEAPRTLELRIDNLENEPVTVVLIGRWGSGGDPQNAISMPAIGALSAGKSEEVKVPFDLGALSVGHFSVQVKVQLVGFGRVITVSSSTAQWPVALFACAVLVLLLLVLVVLLAVRSRRRARRRPERAAGTASPAPTAAPPSGPRAGAVEVISGAPPDGVQAEPPRSASVRMLTPPVVPPSSELDAPPQTDHVVVETRP